jgi:DNA-binding HxlR family transcriptional regulator
LIHSTWSSPACKVSIRLGNATLTIVVSIKIANDPAHSTARIRHGLPVVGLGTARGVLSSRLHKLVDQGILSRRQYCEHPPRYEYTLTDKGRALAPVITALMTWGDTWAPGPSGPPVVLIHQPCGHAMHPVHTCPHCHGEVRAGNVRSAPGPGATADGNRTSAGPG